MKQKTAIKNAAKIAGIEDIDLISEISAAAIAHSVERIKTFPNFFDTVLFVIINDYECDVAICNVSKKDIEYKAFFHQTLNSTEEENRNFFLKLIPKTKPQEQNENYLIKHLFKKLIDDLIKKANLNTTHLDECYVIGESPLIPKIKNWINKYVSPMSSLLGKSFDMIIEGCALYGQMLANKMSLIEIREVATHPIHFAFKIRKKENRFEVMPQNTSLPVVRNLSLPTPKYCDLPLLMNIFQRNSKVSSYLIENLPISEYSSYEWNEHRILFEVNSCGQIEMNSILCHKNQKYGVKLELTVTKQGLNDEEIFDEIRKLNTLTEKINEEIKLIEDNLLAESAIMDLRSFCEKKRNDVEKNLELRSLIKKQILLEIKKTIDFLDSNKLDLSEIEKKKKIITKVLDDYMK